MYTSSPDTNVETSEHLLPFFPWKLMANMHHEEISFDSHGFILAERILYCSDYPGDREIHFYHKNCMTQYTESG